MDKLQAMRAFVSVVESGSFTGAAEILQVPKASVTTRIQALEAHLRVKLLNRSTRSVRTTDDGRAYYEQCVRLLNELEEVEHSLQAGRSTPRGSLRVDMPAALARLVVAPALHEFAAQYPELELRIGSSDRPVDILEEGVDCVIRAGKLQDSGLIARAAVVATMGMFASPGYLSRHSAPAHPHELGQHSCLAFFHPRTGAIPRWTFERAGERIDFQPRPRFQFNDGQSMTAAAIAGMGIFEAPVFAVAEELRAGSLQVVLPDWRRAGMPLNVIYPQNRHLSARVRSFVDWICALLAGHPDLVRPAAELKTAATRRAAR